MAAKKATELIEIRPVKLVETKVRIEGDTPLIVHAWSAKAKREILEGELGWKNKAKAKDPKNPLEDFAASMYWMTPMPEEFTEEAIANAMQDAKFGFPVTGIKQAAISAAYRNGWTKDKMSLRGTFFIVPDTDVYYGGDLELSYDKKRVEIIPNVKRMEQLIEIHTPEPPVMREDMVRVGNGNADIRYRGQFNNWYADLTIRYDENGKYSLSDLLNFLNAGGSVCGIGEWRPEHDGQYGLYHISVQ